MVTQDMSDVEVTALIGIIDLDDDGCVSFEEFLSLMTKRMREIGCKKETHDAFDMFDKNGDGSISANEFTEVMNALGKKLSEEEIRQGGGIGMINQDLIQGNKLQASQLTVQ